MFKQNINNHISHSSSGGLLNHSPGLKYNVTKSRCTMALTLQPLRWCCVDCVNHHERDVREERKYMCAARASNSKRSRRGSSADFNV